MWLVQRFVDNYGLEVATEMLHENNRPPVQTVRVNTTKATVQQAIAKLEAEGLTANQSDVIPECLYITNGQPARYKSLQRRYDYYSG